MINWYFPLVKGSDIMSGAGNTLESTIKRSDYPAKELNTGACNQIANISSIKKNIDELSLNVAKTVSLTKEIQARISKISREINMRVL